MASSGESKTDVANLSPRLLKYQQLRDHIYSEIRSGQLQPGAALPTENELIAKLGMSRNTVRQALGKLVEEGMIQRVQGRGTFVTSEQQRQARRQLDVFALIAPQLREGFYPSLVHGFEQATAAVHHQVLVGNSGNDVGRQGDLVLQMIDQGVGGVAMVPSSVATTPAHQVRMLQKNHIPVVFCHRGVEEVAAPCVSWCGEEVGRTAGRELVALGHRRVVAFFGHLYVMTDAFERGLREALQADGVSRTLQCVNYQRDLPGTYAIDAIRKAVTEIFTSPGRPTAIFCGNLPDAEQVYLQAISLGLRVPDDLSVIYFGGAWRDHGLAERIACVAVDEHEVGVRAARLLNEMRKGARPLDSDEQIVLPVSLIPGETLGAC